MNHFRILIILMATITSSVFPQNREQKTDSAITTQHEVTVIGANEVQNWSSFRGPGGRNSGRLTDLVAYCQGQIKKAPAQTAMRELLAEVLVLAGKPDEAKKALEEAVRLFPKKNAR